MSKGMKRLIWWLSCILIILLAGLAGYLAARNAPDVFTKDADEAAGKGNRLGLECEVQITYCYTLCGHETVQTEQISQSHQEWIGSNESELKEALDGFSLVAFSAEYVELKCEMTGYCEKHYLLFLENGELLLKKRNGAEGENEVVRKFDAQSYQIEGEDRKILENGKVFATIADARAFLQTLQ